MADSKKTKKELIEAVEALQESEEKWHSLAENAPSIIIVIDRDGIIQFINRTPPGFTREESVGKKIYDYLSPEHRKVAKEAIEQVFQTGEPTHYENIAPGPHGRDSWYDTQVGAIKSDGHVVAATLFVTDITKHKKAEEALSNRTEALDAIITNLKQGIAYLDENGIIVYLNQQCADLFGLKYEDVFRKNICDFHPPEKQGAVEALINEFKQGKQYLNIVETVGNKVVDNTFHRIQDGDGNYRGILMSAVDATERKKAEEALRQSEEQYRSVVENIGIGVSLISPEMEILALNRQLREQFPDIDVSKKPICYKAFNQPPRDDVCSYCPTYKSLKDGRVHEAITETPAGEKIVNYRIISSPIKDKNGKVIAAIEMVEDITEFKQIERLERQHRTELAHFSRLSTIGEMSSALAHELNQPLCAIASSAKAALRMMKSGDWDSNELLEAMEEAGIQAERAGKIIHRTTKLVRKKEPHRSRVNIENIIDEAIALIEHEALLRGITIQQVEPSEKLPMFEADAIQIEQVLLNLLRNSFEAMDDIKGGRHQVTIEVSRDESGAVQVAISDTGHGLPAENIDRVFEHFFTTKSQGLGMGLSISRSIIEAHGGRIWAEHNPASGATFRFTLPAGRRIS